ncbi:hypothetical protein KY389_01065, partial [Paracoccus bogoriensis]|uniref:hypothetical protein n=1 Tax=Paracoccus bogoriensis TaxID=242065 RepID=UPI001CA4EEAD
LKYQTPEEFAAARPFDKTQWAQPLELIDGPRLRPLLTPPNNGTQKENKLDLRVALKQGQVTASRTFAVDGTVLRTTGNQSAGGLKTFSNGVNTAVRVDASPIGSANNNSGLEVIYGPEVTGHPYLSISRWAICWRDPGLKISTPSLRRFPVFSE